MSLSRRDFLKMAGLSAIAAPAKSLSSLVYSESAAKDKAIRCINVVNFIRGVEPRFETNLLLPVQKQMQCLIANRLPATWLLQFDALVSGDFVKFLKAHLQADHEVGIWFEMNRMHCEAAGVEWRGRPGYEWDHLPPVAFTIGYAPEERIKLADAAMKRFKEIWGKYPRSIASWNLDSITMAHLADSYGVDAFAVCRDQIATDGFTIWGAPMAGYYPSRTNCWSPALSRPEQINVPMFRMLGQDPVYYYRRSRKLPDGREISEPDTMEPVWTSGRSPEFIAAFLKMIEEDPSMQFAYAQLGQENSFPWRDQAEAYPVQMAVLAKLREAGKVHVETMAQSGRRFKKAFKTTPVQSQIMLDDPFGNKPGETTIWFQSRFYRANLHLKGDLPFLRDITVYSDKNPQPFLQLAARQNDVEQRMPAVLDGYHWAAPPGSEEPGSGGYFMLGGERLRIAGKPEVTEAGTELRVDLPLQSGQVLRVKFSEEEIGIRLEGDRGGSVTLSFEWDPSKTAFKRIEDRRAEFEYQGFSYAADVRQGEAVAARSGWMIRDVGKGIVLHVRQKA